MKFVVIMLLLYTAFLGVAARGMDVTRQHDGDTAYDFAFRGSRYGGSLYQRLELLLAEISMSFGGTVANMPEQIRLKKDACDGCLPRYNEVPCYVDKE